jgi:benzodiazapine receptor
MAALDSPTDQLDWVTLLVWLILVYYGSGVGDMRQTRDIFKRFLSRIAYSPPSWLFGPVWALIYGLMSVGAWLITRDTDLHSRAPDRYFVLHLALILVVLFNMVWTRIFFQWLNFYLALADILLSLAGTLVVVVICGLERLWLPMGAFIVTALWLLYATYNNWAALSYQVQVRRYQRQKEQCKLRDEEACLERACKRRVPVSAQRLQPRSHLRSPPQPQPQVQVQRRSQQQQRQQRHAYTLSAHTFNHFTPV